MVTLAGLKNTFVIPRTLLYRGSLNQGSTVICNSVTNRCWMTSPNCNRKVTIKRWELGLKVWEAGKTGLTNIFAILN